MNNLHAAEIDMTHDSFRHLREEVLLWDGSVPRTRAPYSVNFATQDGIYPVVSWVDPPLFGDPDAVDKVCAVILSLPNHQMYVVSARRDDAIDPVEVMSAELCPVPSVVVDVYDLLQTITAPDLRRFVSDVFTLTPVFHGFWTATAGTKHHAWPGGLAWHSLEVARDVADVMSSPGAEAGELRYRRVRAGCHCCAVARRRQDGELYRGGLLHRKGAHGWP